MRTPQPRSRRILTALTALVVLGATAAGCGGGTKARPSVQGTSVVASTTPPPMCPNPLGGGCLGPLVAGRPYTTGTFAPRLTYRVPAPGWRNEEDLTGNFLLVPPGNDLAGVDAGASDFIGVYTSIRPTRFQAHSQCGTVPVPDVPRTPEGIAAELAGQRSLVTSERRPVRIGSLRGVALTLRIRPGARLDSCVDGGQRISIGGLFSGLPPSHLDHGVVAGMTMRLYLLVYDGGVLAVELDDVDAAPTTMVDLTAVAEDFSFG